MDAQESLAFGDLPRHHRAAACLTQEELAERAGLSVRGISDLERGVKSRPQRDTVCRLIEALRLAPGDHAAFAAVARRRTAPTPASPGDPAVRHPELSGPLPLSPTALIGREQEEAAVTQLLRREDVRLLTLTGCGGVGKTRLALQVAAHLRADFAGGVVFVALAPLSDPQLVIPTVAQAVGITETNNQRDTAALRTYLRSKHVLLLLDNFEHVLAAAPLVADLLAATPHVKVLITSRARLRVRGEQELTIPPLALPPTASQSSMEQLARYPATALFIARVQEVQPGFQPTATTAPAVAEICRRLDGVPLAIELAAARIKVLPPQMLLARLDRRLPLLTAGARDLPERQQTMRRTIAWSYDLLEPVEQALFRRLAVFAGGCTLAALELSDTEPGAAGADVLDGVGALVEKSLLRQEEQADGQPRFSMLEIIREFGLERLAAHDEVTDIQQHHARYYLALAETAAGRLHGRDQAVWLARLESEQANLRAALRWARDSDDRALGVQLSGALWPFWDRHGHLSEGRAWLEETLARAGPWRDGPATPELARALEGASVLAFHQGNLADAARWLEHSLALARELADTGAVARALYRLGSRAR